jgi:hypothetical protein
MARLPDDEIQRRLAEALEQCRMTDEEAAERWPECTPEERDAKRAKSEMARAKHMVVVDDETGQKFFGGPQSKSGQPKKRDLLAQVADLANDARQKEVVDALFAPLSPDEPAAVRGRGAERIININIAYEDEQRKNREELRRLNKDELIERLVGAVLESGLGSGLAEALTKQLGVSTSFDAHGTAEAA